MMPWVVLVLVLSTSGCVTRRWHLHAFPRCSDKLPVKVLLHPACPPDGICGYSCLPDRWKTVWPCTTSGVNTVDKC